MPRRYVKVPPRRLLSLLVRDLRLIRTCDASSNAFAMVFVEGRYSSEDALAMTRVIAQFFRVALRRNAITCAKKRQRKRVKRGGTSEDSGGALLVNGTLELRRTRGVATLPRVVETTAPRDAPRLETRGSRYPMPA